jgi:hypothetical protein
MTTLPNTRVAAVATEIHKALSGVVAADMTRSDATRVQRAASERATGARETALLALAEIAERDKWSHGEIDGGAAQALDRRNTKDNSVATFAAEIKRACNPSARQHVPTLALLCADVWTEEGKAAKDYPRPCRKAFARRYHMLVATFREAIEGRVLSTPQQIVCWAVACDPDRDPVKVLKRLHAVRGQLRALADDWPHRELAVCGEALGRITLEGLKAVSRWSDGAPTDAAAISEGEHAEAAPDILHEALGNLLVAA